MPLARPVPLKRVSAPPAGELATYILYIDDLAVRYFLTNAELAGLPIDAAADHSPAHPSSDRRVRIDDASACAAV